MFTSALDRQIRRQRGRLGAIAGWAAMLLAVSLSRLLDAADWPTFRSDIARTGVTEESIGRDLSLRWTYRSPQAPKPAWPPPSEELPRMHGDNAFHAVIVQGVVYFGSSVTDEVMAVNAASGDVRWKRYTEGPVRFAPSVEAGRVYFGSDDGYVYCLDAADGSLIWKYRAGPSDEKVIGNGRMISLWPVRTSVLVADGVVHFAAGVFPYEGLYIGALRADDGSVLWVNDSIGDRAHELEYGGISPHGYLVASAKVLYVPSGRAMPAAFDRTTGKFLFFAAASGKRGGSWALLDDHRLIAGIDYSGVPDKVAYDAESGKPQGDAFAWFEGREMALSREAAYLITDDGLYAVNRDAYARAVEADAKLAAQQRNLEQQADAWKKRPADDEAGGAAAREQRLQSLAREIEQIASRQEQLKQSVHLWRYPGHGFCCVIRAGDMVWLGGHNITLGLDAATGVEAWRYEVEGDAVALAAATGCLTVSTDTGRVYGFGAGGGAAASDKTIGSEQARPSGPDDALADKYRDAAERIVAATGQAKGYCLVLDCGEGRLALELARRTEMQLVGLESDPAQLAAARARLAAAGLLGSRVAIEPWDLSDLPEYFANLIVSDGLLLNGKTTASPEQVRRVLRPYGGAAYVSFDEQGKGTWSRWVRGPLEGAGNWTQQYGNGGNTACSGDQLVKGPLGILWFGEPGPQGMVERHARAQAPLATNGRLFIEGEDLIMAVDAFNGTLLWKREIPGAVRVHVKADSGNLAATDASLFVAAHDQCFRLDPATGQTLHVYQLPPSPGAGESRRWGYLSVAGSLLYGSAALPMEREYGEVIRQFTQEGQWKAAETIPAELRQKYDQFRKLYQQPEDLRMAAQRYGYMYQSMTSFAEGGEFTQKDAATDDLMVSDEVFAMDAETGALLWTHRGEKIANITLALGDGKIFFADSAISLDQKNQALAQRRGLAQTGVYRERQGVLDELHENKQLLARYLQQQKSLSEAKREDRELSTLIRDAQYLVASLEAELFQQEEAEGALTVDDADVRIVTALDAGSGSKLWERLVDLTGCGGDKMGAAYSDGLLLFFGNHGNHDAWRFRAGGMQWRRITVLAGDTGEMVWSRPLNYRTRPVIVGDQIILEPQACYLRTGATVLREHPITGLAVPWEFLRPGHTCGLTAASADGLFYRSACTAFYDLAADRGVTIFGGYRPGCAISVIPACGVLLSPEAAAGCTCSYPIRCTMALVHKPQRQQPWTVYVTPGELRPVRQLAVNLGAVADMKDDEGTVWFAYPNPNTARYTHFPNYGVKFDLREQILSGMGYFRSDFKARHIDGTDKPWLFTSGCRGLVRCELPLIDAEAGQPAGVYTVRLGFLAAADDTPGECLFDIKLQGKVVRPDCDIAQRAGGTDRAVIESFSGVAVSSSLLLELVPKSPQPTEAAAPAINFIEVRRQD